MAKHTQTMATAKAASGTSMDCLREQEIKRITDPKPAATKHLSQKPSNRQMAANPTKLVAMRHFSPFVVSCFGVLGNDATVLLQTLQDASPTNQESPIPKLQDFMESRMSIAIVRDKPHIYASEDHTHPHYEQNEPTSPVERWSRPQPVLPSVDDACKTRRRRQGRT